MLLSFAFPESLVRKATRTIDPLYDQLWDDYGDDLMQAILEAVAATIDAATVREVRQALAAHDLLGALNAIGWDDVGSVRLSQSLPKLLRGALEDAGDAAADALSSKLGSDVGLGFSITRGDVADWIRSSSDNIIRYLSDAQVNGIQQVIQQVMDQGLSVSRATSLLLDGDLIGLTPRDVTAVFNFLESQKEAGMGLAEADKNAVEYTQRLLANRAEAIAQTEMTRAATQGKLSMWRQAIEDGDMRFGATKTWTAQPDCCDDCDELDGEEVGIEDTFSSGDDGPPAHTRCRCSLEIGRAEAA